MSNGVEDAFGVEGKVGSEDVVHDVGVVVANGEGNPLVVEVDGAVGRGEEVAILGETLSLKAPVDACYGTTICPSTSTL